MSRCNVSEADAILEKEYKVLDHGFVRLIDYMGSDERIAQAARVSYGGQKKTEKEDQLLIDYLMAHEHTSPFEHVVLEFHCKMPIFVARQWVRHRTARLNEVSGRYTVMKDEFYMPEEDRIQFQSKSNRQGSSQETVPDVVKNYVLQKMRDDQERASENYHYILDDNIAKELARINLPLSLYTEWYWQMDAHNLMHFLKLRLDEHAQWEIRQYANVIADIFKTVLPMTWEAFDRHILKSVTFSEDELKVIKKYLCDFSHNDMDIGITGQSKTDFLKKLGRI